MPALDVCCEKSVRPSADIRMPSRPLRANIPAGSEWKTVEHGVGSSRKGNDPPDVPTGSPFVAPS